MAQDPIKAIGFSTQGQVAPLAPLKPLTDGGNGKAIGFDSTTPTGPAPIEGATRSPEYTKGFIPGTNLDDRLAETQNGWDQFGNFAAQTGIEILAGTVEASSYLLDFQQHFDKLRGDEQEYTNWLAESAKSLKEQGKTDWVPVYTSEENKGFEPTSAEWWAANGGQGLGSTLSLLIPGMAVSKVAKIAGLGALGQTISATFASRYAESTMEANQVYQEAIGKGASKEDAGDAASKVFNTNWLFAIQDFTQFAAISKGYNALSKGTKGAGFGQLLKSMASEGGEEAGQYIVSEEAKKTALDANVDYFGAGFAKRLGDYIDDDEFKTSTLLGAVGGGIFHGTGKILDTISDVKAGDYIPKAKERIQKIFSRGIQKEVANSIDDKATSQAITNIDFAQQFADNIAKGRLPAYKQELEDLKKQPDLSQEARESIDEHIQHADYLMTEEAKLRNSDIPPDLHKPILMKKLEANQLTSLLKQTNKELQEIYSKLPKDEQLDPQLIPVKQAHATMQAYSKLKFFTDQLGGDSDVNLKAERAAIAYAQAREAIKQSLPNLDIDKTMRTNEDERLINLTFQDITTKEKRNRIKDEIDALVTPAGLENLRQKEAQRKVEAESVAVLNNPNATKEEILQAEKNSQDTKTKTELAKKFQQLINKDKQANTDQLHEVVDSLTPDMEEPTDPEFDPNMEPDMEPALEPEMEPMPDELEPPMPEEEFPGGATKEQATKWGLTKQETEDLVSKVDVETREPKTPTKEAKEKNQQAKESIKGKTTVSTTALNLNNSNNPITYHNNITGEVAKPEDIFAVDATTGQLLVNTPRIQEGMKVTLKIENNFPWVQQAGFKPNLKDNHTINVYIEGIQRPLTQLRNADNKYLTKQERENNLKLRDLIERDGNLETTIAAKNIGTPRVDNVLRSLEVLGSDFIQGQDGKWSMQVLPHNPIFGLIDHNGTIHTPNIGGMRDINKNQGIENRIEEAKEKYITATDLQKLSGKSVVFRTAPDSTQRIIGLEYRGMTDQERGWVRNNLAQLINTQDFNTLKEAIHIPHHPTGVYKHTDELGRPKKPDILKLDRLRFHLVATTPTTSDFLIPIVGKEKKRLWVVVQNTQLDSLLNNKPFSYRIIDGQGNKSPINTTGTERIVEAFDKLLNKQFKNVNEANLNSEIQYTDPTSGEVYPNYYEYLVKTSALQTNLKGSLTLGHGEDSSYSFNQVSLYLDPNPSGTQVHTRSDEKLIITDRETPKAPEESTPAPSDLKKVIEELFDEDEQLKPYSKDGFTYGVITEKELNWFKDHIGENYLNIAKHVDSFISKNGVQAFGQYYNSLVTVADYAPAGTIYHEAGHFLFDPKNGLVTKAEKEKILNEASELYKIKRSHDQNNEPKLKAVDYKLKAVEILESPKAEEIFKKGEKNGWTLDKILIELAVPKEQKQLLLSLNTNNREELIQAIVQQYTYIVEVNTAKDKEGRTFAGRTISDAMFEFEDNVYLKKGKKYYKDLHRDISTRVEISKEAYEEALAKANTPKETNSAVYANLTVPGGINYTENEIKTPNITPNIKGHAQFSTDQGIGWFRSDDKRIDDNTGQKVPDGVGGLVQLGQVTDKRTRRILEVQSDLFQKGRDKTSLVQDRDKFSYIPISEEEYQEASRNGEFFNVPNSVLDWYDENTGETKRSRIGAFKYKDKIYTRNNGKPSILIEGEDTGNIFLQLLNKDSNWVSFFIKSIIQDSASKGYEKVLFPGGNTASKVEGHETLEQFKAQKEVRLKELNFKKEEIFQHRDGHWKATPGSSEKFNTREEAEASVDIEINQIKEELKRVETEGFAALKPIYNFYETVVGNTLKKLYKDQVKRTKDEYGNEWYELTLKEEHKGTIRLKSLAEQEQSGDYMIEEKIMEEWEKYKLSDGEYKPKVARAKTFFRRILQMIKSILGFKSPIEKLFSKFNNVKSSDINVNPNLENKTEQYKLLQGFVRATQQKEAVQAFASEVMRITNETARQKNIDILDFFTSKDNIDQVFGAVRANFLMDYLRITGTPRDKRSKQDLGRYLSYLAMGIGKSDAQDEVVFNGEFDDIKREGLSPIEGFKSKVLKDLGRWGFKVRLADNTIYDVPQTDDEQTEKQELKGNDEAERLYNIDSTQINPTDSLSQRVRLFLSTIPEPIIDKEGRPTGKTRSTLFGTPKYIDFKKIDAALTLKLVNAIDPLVRLELLSKTDATAKVVLDRLMDEKNKGNDQIYTEFFVKYRRDSYTKKSVLLGYTNEYVKPEDRDPSGHEYIKKYFSKLIDTDRNSVDRVLINKWREEGVRKQTIETDGTVIHRKAVAIAKDFNEFKAKFIEAKDKKSNLPYSDVKTKFDQLLRVLGVDMPIQVWDELDTLKPNEKYNTIQNWMFGLRKHSLEDLIAKYNDGVDPFGGSNIISDLAIKAAPYSENLSRGAYLNESGDQEYPNNTPSYITEFINNSKENADDVVSMFQQDDFYAGNAFLGVIKDRSARTNLSLEFTSSIREGEKDPKDFQNRSEIESLIMRLTAFHNNAADSAYINVGTPADKTKQPMLSLPKYKAQRAKDFLMSVLNRNIDNESVRIQRIKQFTNRVAGGPLPTDVKNLKDNAKFKYIDELNTIPNLAEPVTTGAISTQQFKEARQAAQKVLESFIANEYEMFLKFLEDNDIITTKRNKENILEVATNVRIPEGILYDHKGVKAYTIDSFLKEFFYNDLGWRFEVSKVLQGDYALYTSQDDYFKRQYQLVTPGYKPLATDRSILTRGVYGKQFKQLSEQEIKDLTGLASEDIAKMYSEANGGKGVNKTDAQSLMTIDAYRTLANSLGQWTKDHEDLYELAWVHGISVRKGVAEAIKSGVMTEEQGTHLRILAAKVLLQPFKPFVFRDVAVKLPDGKVMMIKEQIKDSITPITPEMSTVSKGYQDLLNYMYTNNVDIMSAEDTVKVGGYGIINDFTAPLQEWQKRKTNVTDFKFPQFIPDKKKEEVSGTQTHKLILGNIDPKTKYTVGRGEILGSTVIKNYNELWTEKIENSSKDLRNRLGITSKGLELSSDPKKRSDQLFKLHLLLKQELGGRDLNENYTDVLDLIKRGAEEIDFTLPLSFPAFGSKFQSILTNIWKKEVIKQKSPGYSAVNLADFGVGYSDELKFVSNKDGKITEAEVGLPIEYVSDIGLKYGEHILPNGIILWDKLNNNQQQALQFILYRIPTSNKSSMLPVRVARITPAHLNNIVMIPGELTIQQGLDFDVDKSQLIRRTLDKEGKVDDSVDTRLFDLYWGILTNPAHTLELLTPLASPTMEAKLAEFRANGVIQSQERGTPLSTTADVQAEVRNKDGQAQIGIASRFNTGHSVLQTIKDYVGVKGGISIDYNGNTFKDVGQKFDASGVLISNNHAESQQAALDAAKNPLLSYFNVVKGTTAAFHTMLEFGVPLPVAIDFFMQPVIKEWTKFYKHEGQNVGKATEKLFVTYPGIRTQYDLIKKGNIANLSSTQLTDGLQKPVSESNEHSARVLIEFENILSLADQMTNINNVISVDTFQDATGLESLQSFLIQKDNATNEEAQVYIDPRVFDLETTPPEGKRLAAFMKYGIQDPIEYISQFYPSASENYAQMRDYYARATGESNITDKKLTRRLNQFTDYFLTQYNSSLFRALTEHHPLYNVDPKLDQSDYRLRWSFFDPNKSIWKYINSLLDAKNEDKTNKYPRLHRNELIKNLESEESKPNEVQIIGVRNTDAQSDKSEFINAWWDLLNAAEPELKALAYDLVRYAVQTSGFQYSTRSFYDLVPVQYWVENGIGELWSGIVKNPSIDNESAIVNFIRHNFRTLDRFPEIYTSYRGGQIIADSILNTKQVGKHLKEFTLKESYKEGLPLPRFIRINDRDLDNYRLYESSPTDERVFKEVQPLGGRYYTEVSADREPSKHSAVRSQYQSSPDPWKTDKKQFPLFGRDVEGVAVEIAKYLPQETNQPEVVLKNVIAAETDIEAKKGLEVLLKNVKKINTPIEVRTDKARSHYLGALDINTHQSGEVSTVIWINNYANIESDSHLRYVIHHELNHAFGIGVLQNPEGDDQVNFVRNINRIYLDLLNKRPELSMEYGMTNIYEFHAELASNKDFRAKVRGTDLWSRILRAFRKLLGMKDTYDKVLDHYYSILDEAEDLQKINPGEFALIKKEKKKAVKKLNPLEQMHANTLSRIKRLKAQGKEEESKGLLSRLEKLQQAQTNEQIIGYVVMVSEEVEKLKETYKTLSKDPASINPNVLQPIQEQLTSYKLLNSYNRQINRHPEEFAANVADMETFTKQLSKLITDVDRLSESVNRLAVARWAHVVKKTTNDPNLSLDKIMEDLEVADRDITWMSRLLDVGKEIRDFSINTLHTLISKVHSSAWREMQDELYGSEPNKKTAKVTIRVANTNNDGFHYDKRSISYTTVGKYKALTDYEKWVGNVSTFADKFGPVIDSNSLAENSSGVHFISPWSKRGKEILTITVGSPNYPLRQFYETFVLDYLASQNSIPAKSMRPGLRVPTIQKSLMESILEKGVGNKLHSLGEQMLNTIRRRYDESDYYAIDENGNKQEYIPTRFVARQDGKDGRLTTRQVSLDIATTIPVFITEMHTRQGMNDIVADLELGKSVLANRKVLTNTKLQEQPGIGGLLTAEREGSALESGELEQIEGIRSEAYKGFEGALRQHVYGQLKKEEGAFKVGEHKYSVSKIVDAVLKYSGFNLLFGNIAIPLTNLIVGKLTLVKEGMGGDIVNFSNIKAGEALYLKEGFGSLKDLGRREKTTKLGRVFSYFNPFEHQQLRGLGTDTSYAKTIFDKIITTGGSIAEFQIAISSMGAVMDRFKAKNSKGEEVSLYEALDVVNGKVELGKGYTYKGTHSLTTQDIDEIKDYTLRLYQNQYGVNNSLDKPAANEYAIGRLVTFMRGWLVPGINTRWRTKFYDERLKKEQEGHYLSAILAFNNIFTTEGGYMQKMVDTLRILTWQGTNNPELLLHPNELEYSEERKEQLINMRKANIRKTMFELYLAAGLSILLALGWDDDDKESYAKYLTARVRKELITFLSPGTAWSTLRSPTVVLSTIDGFSKIIYDTQNSLGAMVMDEEQPMYERGPGKDQNKLWFDVKRQTGLNALTQFEELGQKTRLITDGTGR